MITTVLLYSDQMTLYHSGPKDRVNDTAERNKHWRTEDGWKWSVAEQRQYAARLLSMQTYSL